MFQLYIENRERFYIKGREHIFNRLGKKYNDSNIITIQDKLNYLLIHESPENKTEIVDKILLRNYSKKILGKDLCPPILKIYENSDDINLNELPEKFVLKCNHGSGMNIICKDKKKFNFVEAKNKLNKWININYGLLRFEYQYLNVKKKIFVEKYLADDIIDYKIVCFNGEPKFIKIKMHDKGNNIINYYDLNWTLTDIKLNYEDYIRSPSLKIKKPINFEKMIDYARKLSSEFCFCRVDFYEVDNVLYLGEMTFSPSNIEMNYNDQKMRIYLGSLLNITKLTNI